MRLPTAIVSAVLLAGVTQHAVAKEKASVRSEYAVSLYGLVLARSSFTSTITRDAYDISGSLSSAGIAAIFDDTTGTTVTKGRFGRGGVLPQSYSVNYTSGAKKKATQISFDGGMANASNTPPVNTRRAGWVPVSAEQLRAVADPISATLVPAASPGEVCSRTIRVYDGAMRADLRLSPAGAGRLSIPGYEGDTVRCSARFVPIAGYRKGHRSIEYLRNSSGISIAFAPVGATGIYAPVEASVGTKIGTIMVRARRFETVK